MNSEESDSPEYLSLQLPQLELRGLLLPGQPCHVAVKLDDPL